jgi:hypothetical protein
MLFNRRPNVAKKTKKINLPCGDRLYEIVGDYAARNRVQPRRYRKTGSSRRVFASGSLPTLLKSSVSAEANQVIVTRRCPDVFTGDLNCFLHPA